MRRAVWIVRPAPGGWVLVGPSGSPLRDLFHRAPLVFRSVFTYNFFDAKWILTDKFVRAVEILSSILLIVVK